jgi:hypothetical protein
MITELTGQDLPQWMAAAREAGLPGISSFAKGLEQDLDAATNGLTMNWSSGPVEGRVNLKDDQAPDVRKGRTPAAPQARPAHRTQLAARTFSEVDPRARFRCRHWPVSRRSPPAPGVRLSPHRALHVS